MADTVYIRYLDDVYIQIDADKSALYSIKERFTFKVPGYQFTPSYKSGYWDGSISLLNLRNRTIYSGLLEEIKEFCKESEFELEIEDHPRFHQNELSLHEAKEFIESLKIPERFELRDYQIQTFVRSIRETRSLVVSPTASGKSYLIYLLLRYLNKKTLIIVPNLNLVHQMYKDFDEYGFDVENNCHKIYAEQEKASNAQVFISTWQSIWKLDQDWFNQFDVVICDECLHPDTLITTSKGKKKISEVKIGELVLSFNEHKKIFEYKEVLYVYENMLNSLNEDFYEIITENGTLKITGNHKILTNRGWIEVKDLCLNDEIINT